MRISSSFALAALASLATLGTVAKADTLAVHSTGLGAVGAADPNYTLTSAPAGSTSNVATISTANSAWYQLTDGSHWINTSGSGNASDPVGEFVYTTTFNIAANENPNTSNVALSFAADDYAYLYLNGQYEAYSGGFNSLTSVDLTSGFHTGANTLTFYAENQGGPAGLYVDVTSATIAATPEPSSLMLLGTGILSAATVTRRRLLNN